MTDWLVKIVLFLLVLAFVIFEAVASALNSLSAEGSAQNVARAAAVAYRETSRFTVAEEAAELTAEERGVELIDLVIDGGEVEASVRAHARTLIIHELEPLERFTVHEASRTVEWR